MQMNLKPGNQQTETKRGAILFYLFILLKKEADMLIESQAVK